MARVTQRAESIESAPRASMNFHSAAFAVFLPLVFAAYWALRHVRTARLLFVLAASLVFYGHWNPKYVLLLLASTVVDYALAAAIGAADPATPAGRRRRHLLVTVSVAGNLAVLGAFKYYGFFGENLALLGLHLPPIDVLLPPGISFYTFQSLSYTIDVYRGHLRPARNLLEFAVYIAFFPQLVAGPIVRAADFLPQLAPAPVLTREQFLSGVQKILVGLAKKVLIADALALGIVDRAFAPGSEAGGTTALLAVYGYALQIYGDFSGYSDIAIGSARLFGFELLQNFDAPYRARNVQEFWRRWHISLSTWLREYLYIPLGGNRKGPVRTQVNVMLTMLLSGLWHGAAWKFVVWGGIHGLGLLWNRLGDRLGLRLPGRLGHLAASILTFHFAAFAFVPFRAPDLAQAGDLLARLLHADHGPALSASVWLAFALGALTQLPPRRLKTWLVETFVALPAPVAGAVAALFMSWLAHLHQPGVPFIYFQF